MKKKEKICINIIYLQFLRYNLNKNNFAIKVYSSFQLIVIVSNKSISEVQYTLCSYLSIVFCKYY